MNFCHLLLSAFLVVGLMAPADAGNYENEFHKGQKLAQRLCPQAMALVAEQGARHEQFGARVRDPEEIEASIRISNVLVRCAAKQKGKDAGYLLLYALDHLSTTSESRDPVERRTGVDRQKALIAKALKLPSLPQSLVDAFNEAADELL